MQNNSDNYKSCNAYGASAQEIKEAVKACYKKDPNGFISMSGKSLWAAVNEEIARDATQTVA